MPVGVQDSVTEEVMDTVEVTEGVSVGVLKAVVGRGVTVVDTKGD